LTKTIDVEIYGQRYAIRGEADEGDIRRLASFVDSQMRHLAEGMNTTTPSKLAVLTALNLAHQLFELERKRAQGEADVERRMKSLMESIEEQVRPRSFARFNLQRAIPFVIVGRVYRDVVDSTKGIRLGHARTG